MVLWKSLKANGEKTFPYIFISQGQRISQKHVFHQRVFPPLNYKTFIILRAKNPPLTTPDSKQWKHKLTLRQRESWKDQFFSLTDTHHHGRSMYAGFIQHAVLTTVISVSDPEIRTRSSYSIIYSNGRVRGPGQFTFALDMQYSGTLSLVYRQQSACCVMRLAMFSHILPLVLISLQQVSVGVGGSGQGRKGTRIFDYYFMAVVKLCQSIITFQYV